MRMIFCFSINKGMLCVNIRITSMRVKASVKKMIVLKFKNKILCENDLIAGIFSENHCKFIVIAK